ncbi:AMP-binding enzyme [Pontibacter ummariensis]|uniref:AMP-binding enzyme n=1 Tax=Pontibacter ummariensis TaxID=1610492 RepID=A0A239E8J5_9BACT|nr:AMP-binding protein [Pontibacter ummariensis]PRY13112.1 AMP-binding enzyme [Pontibacter ummariensis]SNS40333.1 AMP-binding enzyme [Pontibacter ummariensis]
MVRKTTAGIRSTDEQGFYRWFKGGKSVRVPDAGTFWRILQQHGVKVLFTAPTTFRAIKKEDPDGVFKKKYDTASLKFLFLAGERCDVVTYYWARNLLQVPVVDHW